MFEIKKKNQLNIIDGLIYQYTGIGPLANPAMFSTKYP